MGSAHKKIKQISKGHATCHGHRMTPRNGSGESLTTGQRQRVASVRSTAPMPGYCERVFGYISRL
jgi:hypothetical protein